MIVVDVGCHPHGHEESVYKLCDRFHPEILFGFDPYPDLVEGLEWWAPGYLCDPWECVLPAEFMSPPTLIVRRQAAAWTSDGFCALDIDGITTGVVRDEESSAVVVCFDLCDWLRLLPAPVVLKLDCEGAEYPLLRSVHEKALDTMLDLVLVEWHPGKTAHGWYLAPEDRPTLRCPVEDWE